MSGADTMTDGNGLIEAVLALPPEWFAVVDGGQFDDLPFLLTTAGLIGRPLYLEGGSPDNQAAAGFLVALEHEGKLRALLDLLAARPAAVFWSWQNGAGALYRHLRTLNLVEIPNEAGEIPEDQVEPDPEAVPAFETVLFRHWDPNVLSALLPLMTPEQRARFLGAAGGIALFAPDHGGLKAGPRPAGLPPSPHGYLRFDAAQMAALRDARTDASHARIAVYLREAAPDQTAGMDDPALLAFVQAMQGQANAHGVETERGIAKWSYMAIITDGRFIDQNGVKAFIADPLGTPDRQVSLLLSSLAAAAHRLGR